MTKLEPETTIVLAAYAATGEKEDMVGSGDMLKMVDGDTAASELGFVMLIPTLRLPAESRPTTIVKEFVSMMVHGFEGVMGPSDVALMNAVQAKPGIRLEPATVMRLPLYANLWLNATPITVGASYF
jgi:hypothetical protein